MLLFLVIVFEEGTMESEKKLLGFYNYTVILTYIGMLAGCYGIVSAFEGSIFRSVVCLMVSGFCDMFDGAIASTRKRTAQEKCFGIQIDSMSDLLCFGVLPASIVYALNSHSIWALILFGLYVLSALIRLSYFNVDEQERQKTSEGCRKLYYGMPVTLSAIFLPLMYGIAHLFSSSGSIIYLFLLLGMGTLFLLPIPLKKPGAVGKIVMILMGIAAIFLMVLAGCNA